MSCCSLGLRRFMLWSGLILIVVAAGGYGWVRYQHRHRPPDMVAVLQANNRGVGLMEKFQFVEAVAAFEQVADMAPEWLPGQINLGIALLNASSDTGTAEAKTQLLARSRSIFERILKEDPSNLYAHFCLGIIIHDGAGSQKDRDEGALHFEFVTQKDSADASAWYWLGAQQPEGDERRLTFFQKALQLDPHLRGPIYNTAMDLRAKDPKRALELLNEFRALSPPTWDPLTLMNTIDIKYGLMGKYADVIGRVHDQTASPATGPLPRFSKSDQFQVRLQDGTRWATAQDLRNDPAGELRTLLRNRFGAVIVALDYDGDKRTDLFLLGAVVAGGNVRDLLLHNDGNGQFTDVTKAAGLGDAWSSIGCCVADFDNDNRPDLLITGVRGVRLYRNNGSGAFVDVTAKAGLDQIDSVCLGSAFVDLDLDGDLDLVLAQFAERPEDAVSLLKGSQLVHGLGWAVYINKGEAPSGVSPQNPPPLEPGFRRADGQSAFVTAPAPAVSVSVLDYDRDHDPDLLVLADHVAPLVAVNDRLLRSHRISLPPALASPGTWNGALVLDVNHDEGSDAFLVHSKGPPVLLLNKPPASLDDTGPRFQPSVVDSPCLLQAQAIDLDLDGWTDVVGLSDKRLPVLLHNQAGRLVHAPQALGVDSDWPQDLLGLLVTHVDGDRFPDLLVWSEARGLQVHVSSGNRNHALAVKLSGQRRMEDTGNKLRSNADGFGVRVAAQAGEVWAGAENTTLSAGLGQSHQPLVLGLGRHSEADVVRLFWPDGALQAEFGIPSDQVAIIPESNRRKGSCPVLFAWNGHRFVFVNDFLGAGTVGELAPDGTTRPPRPEESVKIESDQLAPLDGHYVLKLAEPMDEVTLLDRLQLVVMDHPADVRVYPDERFVTAGPPASQELLAFREEVFPASARDHRGRDVAKKLSRWDRDTVNEFAERTWLGFAEEHWVELDFGDRLAKFKPDDRVVLCLAGWTDYPYPESIWAANQAGVQMQFPVLERQGPDGKWQSLGEIGFPAGLSRMMTAEVTGKLGGPQCKLRLRTNLDIYWDQIFVATVLEKVPVAPGTKQTAGRLRATALEVGSAALSVRGCMKEYSPDGKLPTIYDYDRLDRVPTVRPAGRLTRLGDVTELLHKLDDRFVIFGPGDEVTVRFDAGKLPELPAGWKRSFVLRTWGYCKDCGPFTATGSTLEPLPFRGMSRYPYGPDEKYPDDAEHREYRRKYNTR